MLLAGVAYGATRYSALKRIEDKKRAEWEAGRPAREAKAAAEKARKSEGLYILIKYIFNVFLRP